MYYFLVDIALYTRAWGNEISWSLLDQETCTTVCCSGPPGSFGWDSLITQECVLEVGKLYKLHCKDSYGDGWHGGYVDIQGNRYCNNFCPDNSDCYGNGEWDPLANPPKMGGALFVAHNIEIQEEGNYKLICSILQMQELKQH